MGFLQQQKKPKNERQAGNHWRGHQGFRGPYTTYNQLNITLQKQDAFATEDVLPDKPGKDCLTQAIDLMCRGVFIGHSHFHHVTRHEMITAVYYPCHQPTVYSRKQDHSLQVSLPHSQTTTRARARVPSQPVCQFARLTTLIFLCLNDLCCVVGCNNKVESTVISPDDPETALRPRKVRNPLADPPTCFHPSLST